jgi:preprotein translocase subunit SecD
MTRRNLLVPLILVVLASFAATFGAIGSHTKPVLGLDLQGGFSVVLKAKSVNGRTPSEESVEKAKDIIRQRVDGLGVAEPDITRQGLTVVVELPGVTDQKKAESLVGCTAKLEFRPVLSYTVNPNGPGSKATTTTTTSPKKTTTTTKGKSSKGSKSTTTTTKPKSTTTTTISTQTTTEGGMGTAGIAPGEGAMPAQFAPTTTTTEPPTTTAPPTTTLPPGVTTTTPATTTTTVPSAAATSSCGTGKATSKKSKDVHAIPPTATPPPAGGEYAFSDDDNLVYTLGPLGFTGEALSSATAALDQQGQWSVNVNVRSSQQSKANDAFNACYSGAATCPGQGSSGASGGGNGAIAIVLDGKVISAPAVNANDLASNQFQITGQFSSSEAKNLALVLRYGSLPVEFEQAALQQVSATLGQDSLHAGLIAGAIGIAAVMLYMILYYRGLGLVVIAGLTVWGGLMYGLVCWLGAVQGLALSLSGITGIIVSVGTTVDSYVVYFERVKDEVRFGRSVRSSTERGFASAIRTILTADISSFIGAFLLWYLTVGPVRGFAFFLGMSVLLDLLVAYLFTRPLVILLGRSKRFTDARFLGLASALDRAPASVEGVTA